MLLRPILLTLLSISLLSACNLDNKEQVNKASLFDGATTGANADTKSITETTTALGEEFNNYWYSGKAELSSYHLVQARYGEMRQGEAVLIFVTEDFSAKKQVKLDYPAKSPADKVPVLKMNFTKRFDTGIYPYSLMLSSFTPVDLAKHPQSLKLTTSAQEWCGHTYSQLNLTKEGYQMQLNSYFESEGDQQKNLGEYLLEDELWNRIRINPKSLPSGKIKLIPSNFAARLLHLELQAVEAEVTLNSHPEQKELMQYSIHYPSMDRKLLIDFEQKFPHRITAWSETYRDGFGANAKMLTTKARLNQQKMLAYWNLNSNADSHLRTELGLTK